MIGTNICVDLGTDNMSVYVEGKGLISREPSVIAYDAQTGKISAIGERAYEIMGKTHDWIDIVRPIKEGSIYNFQAMQSVLSFYIQKICKNKMLKPNVLISVSSEAGTVDKRTVLDLATASGAAKACVIDCALASAIGAGVNMNSYNGVMVVDIGAGKTDIAIIARGMVCISKSIKTAGNAFDEAVSAYLKKEKKIIVSNKMSEKIKKDVGCAQSLEAELAVRAAGKDASTSLPKSAEITSLDVFKSIKDELETIVAAIRTLLENTPPELSADVYVNGIILTGGSALLTGIETFIQSRLGIKTAVANEPEKCVIKGMAKALKAPILLERNGYYYKTRQELGYEE